MIAEAAQRVMSDKDNKGQWDDELNDVLKSSAGDLIVTPKEIDAIAETCAKTVANGLNMALHPGISLEETIRFLS
jgi:spore protease